MDDTVNVGDATTSVALDSAGHVHISYHAETGMALKHAERSTDGRWTLETVDNASFVGQESSLAVDGDDGLHIAYHDIENKDLRYAHRPRGSEWSVQVLDEEGNVGAWPSLAIDPDQGVHVVYFSDTDGTLRHAWTDAVGDWRREQVPMGPFASHGSTSCAIDGEGRLHVTLAAEPEGSYDELQVLYANWTSGAGWRVLEAPLEDHVRGRVSIAVDEGGQATVAYDKWRKNPDVYLLRPNDEGSEGVAAFDPEDITMHPAATYDRFGHLHVCAYSVLMDGLVYNRGPEGWNFIDLEYDAGTASSIVTDDAGHVHISYLDVNHQALRYATNTNLPAPPRDLAVGIGDGYLLLDWSPPLDSGTRDLLGYRISRRGPSMDDYELLAFVDEGTSYNDTDVENHRVYRYRLTAETANGQGAAMYAAETPRLLPGPPHAVRATSGDRYVNLSWEPPTDLGGYQLVAYRVQWKRSCGAVGLLWWNDGPEINWTSMIVPVDRLYLNLTGLVNGQIYHSTVSAMHDHGTGEASRTVSAMPRTVPGAPTNLTVQETSNATVLDWEPPASDGGAQVTEYRVYRGRSADDLRHLDTVEGEWNWFDWDGYLSIETRYVDWDLRPGDVFYYQIIAVNIAGKGPPTPVVRVPPLPLPSAPRDLVARATMEDIELRWKAPEETADLPVLGYRVHRREFDGDWVPLAEVPGNETGHTDATPEPGVGYFYAVSAVTEAGEGPMSDKVLVHLLEGDGEPPGGGDDGDGWPGPGVTRWGIVAVLALAVVVAAAVVVRRRRGSGL